MMYHFRLLFFGLIIFTLFEDKVIMAVSTNLTSIRWAHAVNSKSLLEDALSGNIDMIEADIVLGTLVTDPSAGKQPVMGHPPATTSDISLKQFLRRILEFNKNVTNSHMKKGVKLDFKSTEVFDGSVSMLKSLWNQMNYPVWINADILPGPVNNTDTIPVDPNQFLSKCKDNFPTAVLSIGWTTRWGQDFRDGKYEEEQVDEMSTVVKQNNVTNPLTFPVRAGIAANSELSLKNLYVSLNRTHDVTLTIWSSKDDFVNIAKLKHLILEFGVDKVYLDVPKEVSDRLDLSNHGNRTISNQLIGILFIVLNVILFYIIT